MENMKDKVYKLITPILCDCGKDWGLLLLRIMFGGMMLVHGAEKFNNFAEISQIFPDPIGIGSKLSLILMTTTELVASLMIIIGLFTRLASIPLIFGMMVAAFIAHAPVTLYGSELPLLYLSAFTAILIMGAGRYSADRLIKQYIDKTRES